MYKEKVNRLRVRRELDLISRTYTVAPNTSSSGKQLPEELATGSLTTPEIDCLRSGTTVFTILLGNWSFELGSDRIYDMRLGK